MRKKKHSPVQTVVVLSTVSRFSHTGVSLITNIHVWTSTILPSSRSISSGFSKFQGIASACPRLKLGLLPLDPDSVRTLPLNEAPLLIVRNRGPLVESLLVCLSKRSLKGFLTTLGDVSVGVLGLPGDETPFASPGVDVGDLGGSAIL